MKFLTLPTDLILRACLIVLALVIVLGTAAVLYTIRFLHAPIEALNAPVVFEVSSGSSLSRVSDRLHEAGYLRFPILFNLLGKWQGVEDSIKAGEFDLMPGLSPSQLLTHLVQGDTRQYRVTLLEGWTFQQALLTIWNSEKIQARLHDNSPEQIAAQLEIDVLNPEGLLFPDTYYYTAGTTDIELLKRANARLNLILAEAWKTRLGALPYEDPYQALILASIVEKESAVESERSKIAAVFVRRLELGMRLQSDPTVIYGLGDQYDGDIRRVDLNAETPYNTYRVNGLPPTPIALAGLQSIVASLNPSADDFLYFVSKGDGSHFFSSTLDEHNKAVNRFQNDTSDQ